MDNNNKKELYEVVVKRLLDIICAVCALVLLSPVMLIIAVLVRIKLGSPVLFVQERPGKDEKIFRLYKFRSMLNDYDKNGVLLSNEKRLTNFGRVLRSTSLDELPELVNIIKGDMSIVGPRPLLVKYLSRYDDEQRHRHDVRPGLTGYAQISGRNALTWEDKFKFDIKYVNAISFRLDVKIVFLTVIKVIKRDGINSSESTTMEEFMGTRR